MFSFRRRHQKNDSTASGGPPVIRTSPSLPELSAQGIPWPEDLVDLSALPSVTTPTSTTHTIPSQGGHGSQVPQSPSFQGATKTSFYLSTEGPIPFHKPFRSVSTGTGHASAAAAAAKVAKEVNGKGRGNGKPISTLYMGSPSSHPPSAFENRRSFTTRPRPSQKRSRNPTTFNIMVRPLILFFICFTWLVAVDTIVHFYVSYVVAFASISTLLHVRGCGALTVDALTEVCILDVWAPNMQNVSGRDGMKTGVG